MLRRLSSISLPLLGLVCLFLTPAAASASGGFRFSVTSLNATTASVRIDLRFYYGDPPCVPYSLQNCVNTIDIVRITPCPPGVPCVNGTYEFQMDYFATVALDYGATYHFSGSREQRWGQGTSSACPTTCLVTNEIPTISFTAPPADLPHLDINPISEENGTMWVDAAISNTSTTESDCWKGTSCPREWVVYQITPCPLAIEGNFNVDNYCRNGTLSFANDQHHQFALQTGLTYTFAGSAQVEGWDRVDGGCWQYNCDYFEVIPSKTFKATTVATEPTTWGHVKSLYRAP